MGPFPEQNRPRVEFRASLAPEREELLFDPQTSGGLLIAVPEDKADALERAMIQAGEDCWKIGSVREGWGVICF